MATKAGKPDKSSRAKRTIIDVTHADSAPPSPNSKSVIVPSRPILKDPMVVEERETEGEQPKPEAQNAEKDILADAVTEPLSSDKPAKAPTVAELAEAAANEDKKKAKAAEQATERSAAKAETEPENETSAEAGSSEEVPAKPDKAAGEAEAAKVAKHDQTVEKLVESKQYYLPIETIEKRRSKRFVAMGVLLSLLLIVAWADIALDAGLIQLNGVKPVTHFFSN